MGNARNSRVTADVTLEAHNLLRDAVIRYDSSKGKLLERMIRSFCGTTKNENNVKAEVVEVKTKKPAKRFIAPTVEQVVDYCNERCNQINAESFVDHYTANGWVQGKGKPVKDWKACIRTWEKNTQNSSSVSGVSKVTAKNMANLEGDW